MVPFAVELWRAHPTLVCLQLATIAASAQDANRYVLSGLCSRIRENSGDQKVPGHFGPKSHDFGYTCCLQFLAMYTLSRYANMFASCRSRKPKQINVHSLGAIE